jgi:hypothetical protein
VAAPPWAVPPLPPVLAPAEPPSPPAPALGLPPLPPLPAIAPPDPAAAVLPASPRSPALPAELSCPAVFVPPLVEPADPPLPPVLEPVLPPPPGVVVGLSEPPEPAQAVARQTPIHSDRAPFLLRIMLPTMVPSIRFSRARRGISLVDLPRKRTPQRDHFSGWVHVQGTKRAFPGHPSFCL